MSRQQISASDSNSDRIEPDDDRPSPPPIDELDYWNDAGWTIFTDGNDVLASREPINLDEAI